MTGPRARVFTISAGVSFVDLLAAGLMRRAEEQTFGLASMIVLLPTRRAVRALGEAFLRRGEGGALLLPRMRAIGDVEMDEIAFEAGDEPLFDAGFDLPPAISELRRRLLMSRLILGQRDIDAGQAARLAAELGRLLDQVQTERLSFDALADLVPQELASHWQETLRFLEIVTAHWPGVLAEAGCVDPAARRNLLMEAQAAAWRRQPPAGPVIAAGSTGSVPATAELLAVVAALPQGAIVLPGLDRRLDRDRMASLPASHPQYGMARLLENLDIAPGEVAVWPESAGGPESAGRARLIAAAMRPADWAADSTIDCKDADAVPDPAGVMRIDCPTPREEAGVIALMMRGALENPGKTAALVTADRGLARRVAAELGRWDIDIDDSAGRPLAQTPNGRFLRLAAAAVAEAMAPVPLLALLKHPLAAGGMAHGAFRARVRELERAILRGPRPAPGIEGLESALGRDVDAGPLREWLAGLKTAARDFVGAIGLGRASVGALVDVHIAFVEALAASDEETGAARLWSGAAGAAAALFLTELREAAQDFPAISGSDYPGLFAAVMEGRVVRPIYGRHPRLAIWGPLEARLQQADLLILGGLNEGSWPPDPGADPWMSRPMRARFGLPPAERRIGLAAHDFAQGFACPEVVLTRSARVDGVPSVPSRWLLRLDATLRAAGREEGLPRGEEWLMMQAALDRPEKTQPCAAPAPSPPLSARPRRLSVTQVETWMRDPYGIYARHILCLSALEAVDSAPDAADRGSIIHRALDAFVKRYPDTLPDDARAVLLDCGRAAFAETLDRPGVWAFWWPRFERAAAWFLDTERQRRAGIAALFSEVRGERVIPAPGGDFLLRATADRIERRGDGTLAIIDYKTGQAPSAPTVVSGLAPQLVLEALIAESGGFAGLAESETAEFAFWQLGGGANSNKIAKIGGDPQEMIDSARDGMAALIAAFDDPATPYLPSPDPAAAPKFNDYAHLARMAEWAVSGDGE